ncbi:NAD(P)-binding protein [Micromonospora sp. R77]|uniref:NAD(P)-binding protein n=1 Tax=Micromonospora sp. R77 TaxID=2925836 RepID=UPI0035B4F69E
MQRVRSRGGCSLPIVCDCWKGKSAVFFDVVVVGAGPGGLACTHEVVRQDQGLRVLLLEAGRGCGIGRARSTADCGVRGAPGSATSSVALAAIYITATG